jgi:hypothetical protein
MSDHSESMRFPPEQPTDSRFRFKPSGVIARCDKNASSMERFHPGVEPKAMPAN